MRLITGSIRNPIAIGVAVLLVCLFGALSLKQLPLQLFPGERHGAAQRERASLTIAV